MKYWFEYLSFGFATVIILCGLWTWLLADLGFEITLIFEIFMALGAISWTVLGIMDIKEMKRQKS